MTGYSFFRSIDIPLDLKVMQTAHIRQIFFGIMLADIHLIFEALLTNDKLCIINFVQVFWYGLFLAELWVLE